MTLEDKIEILGRVILGETNRYCYVIRCKECNNKMYGEGDTLDNNNLPENCPRCKSEKSLYISESTSIKVTDWDKYARNIIIEEE